MSFLILDIDGHVLTPEDRNIVQHPATAGVIIFSRNYENKQQLKSLTASIRRLNPAVFIVTDQEGGPVQRLRQGFTPLPSMRSWGRQYENATDQGVVPSGLSDSITRMVEELKEVGIQLSFLPVLDLDYGVSTVIGERSFGRDPDQVTTLASHLIEALHDSGMPAVGKHYPGHGGAKEDSHDQLALDNRPFDEIFAHDLVPYRRLLQQLDAIMAGHVVYTQVDALPAGFSKIWLQKILRTQLGFEGLVFSDCLSMKATEQYGDYPERARLALEAGCDLLNVCNNRTGVVAILDKLGNYSRSDSQQRIDAFIRKMASSERG